MRMDGCLLTLLLLPCTFAMNCPSAVAQSTLSFTTEIPTTGPVLHKPYTAEKHMHRERRLADGTLTTQNFEVTEARDDSGNTATAMHEIAAAGQERHSPIEGHFVFDPAAHTVLQWNSALHVAQLIHIKPPADRFRLNAPEPPHPEDLGHRMIQGYAATGTRTMVQSAGGAVGSATPLRSTSVIWRSDTLEAELERSNINPQTGTTTWQLVSLQEGPPDPALFHLPSGYTLHDVPVRQDTSSALPPAAVDLTSLPAMTYDEALDKLDDQADATVAAAVLMKMEGSDADIERKDKAVYAVARKGLSLEAAEILAQADVHAEERAIATPQRVSSPSMESLREERQLARYWDTLGYTLQREGKNGTPWLLAAWTLNPLAYYASHLGQAYEQNRMRDEAISVYRAALRTEGSPEMKQSLQDRLHALAGPDQSAAAPAFEDSSAYSIAAILYVAGQQPSLQLLSSGGGKFAQPALDAAKAAAATWTLPDTGPEQIIRLVAVRCDAHKGCATGNLPARLP